MIILNIGLNKSANFTPVEGAKLTHLEVINAIAQHLPSNTLAWVKATESETEQTLVVALNGVRITYTDDAITKLSTALSQDCIAVFDTLKGEGVLLGEFASEWGTFNPKYFLLG